MKLFSPWVKGFMAQFLSAAVVIKKCDCIVM